MLTARIMHSFLLFKPTCNFKLQLLRLQFALAFWSIAGDALPLLLLSPLHGHPSRNFPRWLVLSQHARICANVSCNAAAVSVCYMATAALSIGRTPLIMVWTASLVARTLATVTEREVTAARKITLTKAEHGVLH